MESQEVIEEKTLEKKYKIIRVIIISLLIFGIFVVAISVYTVNKIPYLSHVFSDESDDPFYKENQVFSKGSTYVSDQYNISIWYPDLYIVEDNIPTDNPSYTVIATFTSSKSMRSIKIQKGDDTYLDGMAMIYFNIPQEKKDITLDEIIELKKIEYSEYPEVSIMETGNITLGNTDGQYLLYEVQDEDLLRMTKEVFVIKNGKLFNLTFTDVEDEFPISVDIADKMFQSFIIK